MMVAGRNTYHKDDGPALDEIAAEALINNPLGRVNIEGREDVVEEYDLSARVDRTG